MQLLQALTLSPVKHGLTLSGAPGISFWVDPVRRANLPGFYARHGALIDLFVYVILFTAIARIAFRERFPGRPGRVLSVATGLTMAISLSMAEVRWGFRLSSFGPLVAAILITLVAVALIAALRRLGLGVLTGLSMAILAAYFIIRAATPELTQWVAEIGWLPWVNLAVLTAILLVIFRTLWWFHQRSNLADIRRMADDLKRSPDREEATRARQAEEQKMLEAGEKKGTRGELKESAATVKQLKQIKRLLKSRGLTDTTKKKISGQIQDVTSRQKRLERGLKELRLLTEKAESIDRKALRELKEGGRPDGAVDIERAKLRAQSKTSRLEQDARRYAARFSRALKKAMQALRRGDVRSAVKWIAVAVRQERKAQKIFRRMENLQKRLIHLTGKKQKLLPPGNS